VSKVPKKTSYLVSKGSRFYFRIRIPDELREAIGKKEHSEALGDLNKAQAEVAATRLGAEWLARFLTERHRLGIALNPPAPVQAVPVVPSRVPTLQEVQALATLAGRAMLDADEEGRIEGAAWTTPPDFGPGHDLATALPDAVAGRSMEGVAMQAEDWLGTYGLVLPQDQAERRRVLYTFATAMAKARKGQKLRDEGEPVETPPVPALPASLVHAATDCSPADKPADLLMLRDVFELWRLKKAKGGGNLAAKTVARGEEVLEAFEEACGNPRLVSVTRQHAQQLREYYLAKGLHPRSVKDRVDWVRAMLNYEVEEFQRLPVNPWPRLNVEGSSVPAIARKDTRGAELAALFSRPLFQAYALPAAENAGRDAAYWVPVLGVYTGARITELAQLLTADVFEKGGLWVIAFRVTFPDWQYLKGGPNGPSKREIPVHPELVRLGFLDYCSELRRTGNVRLFPLAKVSKVNNAGGALSSWFSQVKTDAGWSREHVFHSFRHGVETILKRAKEPKPHIDRYTGHRGKDVADRDYTHLQAEDLIETAAKVRPQGLELPRVFPPAEWTAPPALDGVRMTGTVRGRKKA